MKLYGLFIVRVVSAGDPVICCHSVDVSSVGFFQRSSAKEFLIFLARTVSKRVTPGSRNQVSQDAHVIYCQSRSDGLAAVAICDSEYNNRVAFTLLSTILGDFAENFRGKWENASGVKDNYCAWPELDQTLTKYQNPEEADKILKIKREIEETKVVMHQAVEALLRNDEKLHKLVEQSQDLSSATKSFYGNTKKLGGTCACTIS